ncbi:MAG: response regulator [Alphaproteobacteria bacterium]|uniref:histidine kinase n=1 Tax=Candidatus Nitrobium versatile TaxID=2884831 RepID=A0A953J226_9BACT|nr:response regulator [Candidatus Nitrobium versatile]
MSSKSVPFGAHPLPVASIIGAVFVLDIITPVGLVEWILYLIPLLLAYRMPGGRPLLVVPAVCIVFMFTGLFFSPPGVPFVYGFINRVMGTFVLSGTAALLSVHKRAEEKLLLSERKYRTLVDSAREAIFVIDADTGIILDANKQAGYLTGLPLHQVIGLHQSYLYPPGQWGGLAALFSESLPRDSGLIRDRFILHADGRTIPVDISGSIIEVEGKKAVQYTFYDMSERKQGEEQKKQLEQQLIQAQKMESIGQLAGGVAHDFNNLLTTVLGYASLMPTVLHCPDQARAYLGEILRACERASDLTRSLLAFSRKQIIEPKPVNLNDIVKSTEKMLRRLIGEDIELKTLLSRETLPIMADRTQMGQVVMNLITNARDSMPGGGRLTIETGIFCADEQYLKKHLFMKPGRYAVLSVSDTGEGMDEKTKERIFEPFFTTKELGRGTGLGLSIVYGIVKQHEGYINVYSEPAKGTIFRIYLPLLAAEKECGEVRIEQMVPQSGSETILIAEDDAGVRLVLKEFLEEYGYRVIEAADGEEAVRLFEENRERVHLALIDVIMPKKNGREVFEEMRAAVPDVRVLFMSGYTADIISRNGVIESGFSFISKPVEPDKLLATIRTVLD